MADDAKPSFPYKTQPFGPYQRDILLRSCRQPAAYYNMEQGTGKTWVTINLGAYLYLTKKIDGMVVVAPKGVHAAWAYDQLPQHMPDVVPWKAYVWRSEGERGRLNAAKKMGLTSVERREEWDLWQMVQDKTIFPILCINSEAITIELARKAIGTFVTRRQCLFVVDEAGDFTTPSAERVKELMRYRDRVPYRRMLEGVIVGTSPLELYAPFRFLDPNILGYRTFGIMKERHAEWITLTRGGEVIRDEAGNRIGGGREFKIVKTENGKKCWKELDILKEKIAPYTYRATKAEALPFLPPKQFHKIYFPMTAEQWRLTGELMKEMFTTTADGRTVTVNNPLTTYLRFQQISCGYVPTDIQFGEEDAEPEHIIPGPNPRLEYCLEELLRYNGAPTIIWTRFKFDIDLLSERLRQEGIAHVTYDGRTGLDEREEAKARFQAGQVSVFIGNSAAGGRGLNLFKAEREIFYANYFGLRRRLQAEDRGHRIGSRLDQSVRIADLVAERSVDLMIVRALRNNQEVTDAITGDPAKDWI